MGVVTPPTVEPTKYYLNSDLTHAAITNPVANSSVTTKGGVFEADQAAWKFGAGTTVTSNFKFDDINLVQNNSFVPVSYSIVCKKIPDATVSALRFHLSVNTLDVYTNWDPAHSIDSSDPNFTVFTVFIPATVFNGETSNTAALDITAGGPIYITALRVALISGFSGDEIEATITSLKSLMAELGNQHASIVNQFTSMETLTAVPVLAEIHTMIVARKEDFVGADGLDKKMRALAASLKVFCSSYGTVFVPTLGDATVSREDKLELIKSFKTLSDENSAKVTAMQNQLTTFKSKLLDLNVAIAAKVAELDSQYTAQLATVTADIATLDIKITAIGTEIALCGIGLAVGLTVAAVGFFFFPVGTVIAVFALIGAGISLGFLIAKIIELNDLQNQRTTKKAEQADLTNKINNNKLLVANLNTLNANVVAVEKYTNGIKKMWDFLASQLVQLQQTYEQWESMPASIQLLQNTIKQYEAQICPMFTRMGDVLDAYLVAFPA